MLQNIKIGAIVANLIDHFLLPPLLRFLENSFPAFSTGFSSEENIILASKIQFQAKNTVFRG